MLSIEIMIYHERVQVCTNGSFHEYIITHFPVAETAGNYITH